MKRLSRRNLLLAGAGILTASAGCISNEDDGIQDSDGDGVIDSEDYAPRDPDVQSKEDVQGTPTPTRETATSTTTRTTTTRSTTQQTTTTVTTTESASESVSDEKIQGDISSSRSGVTAYNAKEVTTRVRDYPEIEHDPTRLLVVTSKYPNGDVVAYAQSDTFRPPTDENAHQDITVTVEGEIPEGERLYHAVLATPDKPQSELSSEEMTLLCHSGAFKLEYDGDTVRDDPDYLPGDDEADSYSRTQYEGSIDLDFEGRTNGQDWSAGLYIYKAAYAEVYEEPRGRGYDEYVTVSVENGTASALAEILDSNAEDNGFEGKHEKAEFVIDFVQNLPYVTDDVSRGYDDYPKFPTETLVDADGDCEDTAILLASILQAEPFNYDMILIEPPGHMAAGVYGEDLNGIYYELDGRDYYYIETTGTGWGVGDMPEQYEGERASLYQV